MHTAKNNPHDNKRTAQPRSPRVLIYLLAQRSGSSLLFVMPRTPMIRFRYGAREAINAAMGLATGQKAAASSSATAPTTGASQQQPASSQPVMAQFKSQLPAKFRPRPFDEEELEVINLGGASPFVPKGKK
jgi:hypothetical protein